VIPKERQLLPHALCPAFLAERRCPHAVFVVLVAVLVAEGGKMATALSDALFGTRGYTEGAQYQLPRKIPLRIEPKTFFGAGTACRVQPAVGAARAPA
jgi:hypothetical protein